MATLAVALALAATSGIRTLTFPYHTHDGHVETAYLVVPAWYGAARHPALPLVISPHGRGVRRGLQAGSERRGGAGKAPEEGGEHGAGKSGRGGGGADLALEFPLAGVRSDRDVGE